MMRTQIKGFIECAEAYLSAGSRYERGEAQAIAHALAGRDCPGLNAVLPEWWTAFQKARTAMLDAVPSLAGSLEAANLDMPKEEQAQHGPVGIVSYDTVKKAIQNRRGRPRRKENGH
jgi:hypothetical protein